MGFTITYFIVLVLLLTAELFYFRIADRFNIIDKPNERSSHNYITIRGDPRMGVTVHHNVYERARFGARSMEPCKSMTAYEDKFLAKPLYAYYRFDAAGNTVNGKRRPAGLVTEYP